MPEFERIRYEDAAPGVARIVLPRSEKRNAQDRKMLYEIDRAFRRAVAGIGHGNPVVLSGVAILWDEAKADEKAGS